MASKLLIDPDSALLADLLKLARSSTPLPCDCLRSVQAHTVKQYDVEGATLAFPLLGNFRFREKDGWADAAPGQILLIPNARSIDIEYVPDPEACEFVALSVVLFDEQLEAARLLLAAPPDPDAGEIAKVSVADYLEPLSRWTQAMRDGKRALSLHSMVEVTLRLYDAGYRALLNPRPLSLAMKIRRLVARNPAHCWNAAEIEGITGLSGPTLRRRLADDSTNLRTLIADARVSEGLRLLMTSSLPVKTIAAKVGYSSVSSFSRQFTERYGTEPVEFR